MKDVHISTNIPHLLKITSFSTNFLPSTFLSPCFTTFHAAFLHCCPVSSFLMVGNGSCINYECPVIQLLLIDGNLVGGKPMCIIYSLPQGTRLLHGGFGRTRNLLVIRQALSHDAS